MVRGISALSLSFPLCLSLSRSYGAVFKALHKKSGTQVAIKEIPVNPTPPLLFPTTHNHSSRAKDSPMLLGFISTTPVGAQPMSNSNRSVRLYSPNVHADTCNTY